MKAIEENLGIPPGGTTEDKLFTFSEVECLGACVNGPMLQMNDDFYEDLTPETTHKLLNALKAAAQQTSTDATGQGEEAAGKQSSADGRTYTKGAVKIPAPGPLSGRSSCENSAGLTCLKGPFWGPETTRSDL